MPTPIERMIDDAVACCKCNKGRRECRCYIELRCPECGESVPFAERQWYDPPEAVRIEAACRECRADGSTGVVRYYDAEGRVIAD